MTVARILPAETALSFDRLQAQAQRLTAAFASAGHEPVAPAALQPAGVFLDVIGEALRARTYVFTDPGGTELCLRPDLTVPVCRLHLERDPSCTRYARYCYNGPAYRYQPAGAGPAHPREFRQAGIEQIGSRAGVSSERADAEVLAIVLDALSAAGLSPRHLDIRAGDLGLAHAILAAVDMPARWRRRLAGLHGRPEAFLQELNRLSASPGSQAAHLPPDLLARLAATHDTPTAEADRTAITAAHLDERALEIVGARSLPELAAALAALARDGVARPLDSDATAVIEQYAAITCPLTELPSALRRLSADTGIAVERAIRSVEDRVAELSATGVDPDRITFSAEFGRSLAYYTGFVFEIGVPGEPQASPLAGGGRYDGLMRACGAPRDIPAVGAAIHTERLLASLAAIAGESDIARPAVVRSNASLSLAAGDTDAATHASEAVTGGGERLVFAVPSKGRLMEETISTLAAAGLTVRRPANARGYRGTCDGFPDVEVAFVSASEIARHLLSGSAHFGITGEDLVREYGADDTRVEIVRPLSFGRADVVVAVPDFWIDIATMADLDRLADVFRARHGRALRVATKYLNLTRRYFAIHGVSDYRLVESTGATEGAPAAGTADLIVDITSTGETLRANGLRILTDGTILKSEANVFRSRSAPMGGAIEAVSAEIVRRLGR